MGKIKGAIVVNTRAVPCVLRHAPRPSSLWQRKSMFMVIRMWRPSILTTALDAPRAQSYVPTGVLLFTKNEWRTKSYGRTRSNFIER